MTFKRSVSIGAAALLVIGGLGVLAACAMAGNNKSSNTHVPEPAKPVDLDRYLGQWNEFVRYENRFERGCEAVTANYTKRDDGHISVINSFRRGGVERALRASAREAQGPRDSYDEYLQGSFS